MIFDCELHFGYYHIDTIGVVSGIEKEGWGGQGGQVLQKFLAKQTSNLKSYSKFLTNFD